MLERVADAVAYAHRHRVAHRGLNPHAVLVAPQADSGLTVALRPELAALVDDLRDRLESIRRSWPGSARSTRRR